jgi:hypothetical protein
MIESGEQASWALYQLLQQSEDLQAEMADYKVLGVYTTPGLFICTNEPVAKVADLKA